ncbi:hypothetical protein ACFSVM_06100 [Paenibacillus shunpengii]|uniref:Zinc ribbon domain-containing protein n=1 Tax=Paenibacillus shunpengii TaxID=2054424 RepID=A0ABW5SJR5_9BACL|nr:MULTISPECIES: hypothetical protein [unclassified Paenibacillus]OMC71154.1 hypothetical protein BK126_03315 [Paenibacillus sp. FSL H7-0326]SDW18223.1 hypothetical protein SAMN05518848_101548 [Paenibacillus sp. PDC88]
MNQKRSCAGCGEPLDEHAFKCKNCGELAVKKQKSLDINELPGDELFYVDRYSAVLLVILTIVLSPIAILVGTFLLFHDDEYRRDVGQMMVTGGLIVTVVWAIVYFGWL